MVGKGAQVKRLKYEAFQSYLSSEVRLMINTIRSILGRLFSFSMGRGRLLASLLIGSINMLVVRLNMVTDRQQTEVHVICDGWYRCERSPCLRLACVAVVYG